MLPLLAAAVYGNVSAPASPFGTPSHHTHTLPTPTSCPGAGEAAKQTIADYAIVRRVHFIFERAVRKFKRDLSLWSAWLQFCRATHSYRRLSRVAARALQLHPMEPGLWMFAASWEFEARGDVPAARSLMQQGLRMCKQSPQLWLEYFNMVGALAMGALGGGWGARAG